MKVGTDGVLLGAWVDCADANTILDVGTGSGLIALMLAQRCNAKIDAIDIDQNAYLQAGINFGNSPFAKQLQVYPIDFRQYCPEYSYDLIVSNPPYFVDSLKSPDSGRNLARHTGDLSFEDLVNTSCHLLSKKGRLCLIIPFEAFKMIDSLTNQNDLFLTRKTIVRPRENFPPKRILLEYSKRKTALKVTNMFIEKTRHIYSEAYIDLTKNYYLRV
jgi:tRNA1Val (adenine37-N6)-methyltransferase